MPVFLVFFLSVGFVFLYHGSREDYKEIDFGVMIFSAFFWNGLRKWLWRRWMRKSGFPATGRLLRTVKTGNRSGSDPELKITLAITGPDGSTWEASARQIILQNQLYAMAPGTLFKVLYDPRDPGKILLNGQARAASPPPAPPSVAATVQTISDFTQAAPQSSWDTVASAQAFQAMIAKQDAVQKRLLPRGILAPAKVMVCTPLHATMNHRDPLVMLMLEVQPDTDPIFMAQANVCLDVTRLGRFAPGSIVYVKYNPADKCDFGLVGSEKPS